jgi:hypothetical protein
MLARWRDAVPPSVACPHQIIEPIIQRRVGRRQTPAVSAALCEFVHNHLRSSGTEYGARRVQAMTQQPVKRIPQWLRIDLLVIVVSLAMAGLIHSWRADSLAFVWLDPGITPCCNSLFGMTNENF